MAKTLVRLTCWKGGTCRASNVCGSQNTRDVSVDDSSAVDTANETTIELHVDERKRKELLMHHVGSKCRQKTIVHRITPRDLLLVALPSCKASVSYRCKVVNGRALADQCVSRLFVSPKNEDKQENSKNVELNPKTPNSQSHPASVASYDTRSGNWMGFVILPVTSSSHRTNVVQWRQEGSLLKRRCGLWHILATSLVVQGDQ